VLLHGKLGHAELQELSPPITGTHLKGVAESNGTLIVAGEPGILLRGDDLGRTWHSVDIADKHGAESYDQVMVAVCGAGWVRTDKDAFLVTADGGVSWHRVAWSPVGTADATSIAVVDARRMWVESGDVFFTTDGGRAWSSFSDGQLGMHDGAQRYFAAQYLEEYHAVVALGTPKIALCSF
jgi:photosystem II stability/assembly factor-like uncharacterized protein